jgi:hypothetical protein
MELISLLNVQEQEILNGRRMKKCGIPMGQVDEEWL